MQTLKRHARYIGYSCDELVGLAAPTTVGPIVQGLVRKQNSRQMRIQI
jgi:hypothetical protein